MPQLLNSIDLTYTQTWVYVCMCVSDTHVCMCGSDTPTANIIVSDSFSIDLWVQKQELHQLRAPISCFFPMLNDANVKTR